MINKIKSKHIIIFLVLLIFSMFTVQAATFDVGSLLYYYRLDESTGNAIDSMGNANLTETGTVPSGLGHIEDGNRGTFSKTQYFSNQATGNFYDNSQSFCAGVWINATSAASAWKHYFVIGSNEVGCRVTNEATPKPKFQCGTSGSQDNIAVTAAPTVGAMTHLVVSFNVTHMAVWVNGVDDGSIAYTRGTVASQDDLWLGVDSAKSQDSTQFLLEQFFFYDAQCDQEIVDYIYNSGDGRDLTAADSGTAPSITQTTYNLSSALYNTGNNNATSWRSILSTEIITRDQTPTIRFNTDSAASCRFHTNDQNWTTMGSDRNCSTTGSISHICSLGSSDELTISGGVQPIYIGCIDGSFTNETYASTSGALNVSLDYYRMEGYVFESDSSGFDGATVIAINETDFSFYGNTTTNASGYWNIDLYSGNWSVYAIDLTNSSQNSVIQSWVSVP